MKAKRSVNLDAYRAAGLSFEFDCDGVREEEGQGFSRMNVGVRMEGYSSSGARIIVSNSCRKPPGCLRSLDNYINIPFGL